MGQTTHCISQMGHLKRLFSPEIEKRPTIQHLKQASPLAVMHKKVLCTSISRIPVGMTKSFHQRDTYGKSDRLAYTGVKGRSGLAE